jgi:hypothetical protein
VHPISARESRALRKLLREAPKSPYVFISERRAPLSAAGYQRMVARAGRVHSSEHLQFIGMQAGGRVCSLLSERIASASRLQRSTRGANARPQTSKPTERWKRRRTTIWNYRAWPTLSLDTIQKSKHCRTVQRRHASQICDCYPLFGGGIAARCRRRMRGPTLRRRSRIPAESLSDLGAVACPVVLGAFRWPDFKVPPARHRRLANPRTKANAAP